MYIRRKNYSNDQQLKIVILISVIIGFLYSLPIISQANEEQTGSFSAKAILPDNQLNKEVTYYDLRVKPGMEQSVDLELYNSTKEAQKVSVTINPGITNDNGLIDYSEREKNYKYDESLKLSITDIATTDKEVLIPPLSKIITKIHVKVPNQPFKGMILGGVYLTSLSEEKEKSGESDGGMQIKNKIVYSIGLKLTESDEKVQGDLLYEKGNTFASQEAGRNIIKAKIRNLAPINVDEISYHAKIYAKNEEKVLVERAVSGYRMAPNSYFHYQIPWGSKPFQAGKYRIDIQAESKATGQKWQWKDEFEISKEEATKLNESAIDLEESTNWVLYLAMGVGGVVLISLILLLILIQKKKKEKQRRLETQRKQRQRKKNKQRIAAEKNHKESSSRKAGR